MATASSVNAPATLKAFGLWRSLVARSVRVGEVAGSNPVSPIPGFPPAPRVRLTEWLLAEPDSLEGFPLGAEHSPPAHLPVVQPGRLPHRLFDGNAADGAGDAEVDDASRIGAGRHLEDLPVHVVEARNDRVPPRPYSVATAEADALGLCDQRGELDVVRQQRREAVQVAGVERLVGGLGEGTQVLVLRRTPGRHVTQAATAL